MVALGSGAGEPPATSGVPSSKQKFRERSVYVRLQVGQRFIGVRFEPAKRAKAYSLGWSELARGTLGKTIKKGTEPAERAAANARRAVARVAGCNAF